MSVLELVSNLTAVQNLLLGAVCILLLYWMFWARGHRPGQKLPPGPPGYPLIGNLLSLGPPEQAVQNLKAMRKKYKSDIIYLNMAGEKLILLYSYDAVHQAFQVQGDEFDSRPPSMFYMKLIHFKGLVASSGKLWKEQRRFALRTLKDFGVGTAAIGDKIDDEAFHFCSELEKHGQTPFQISETIDIAISNVICALAFGKRFQYEDRKFRFLNKLVRDNMTNLGKSIILNYAQFLQYVPFDLFGFQIIRRNMEELCEFFADEVEEHKKSFDEHNITDFIDAYLSQQKNGIDGYTDEQLNFVLMDLFVAGSETSGSTLRWAVLLMTLYADVQRKVQSELDDVVPRGRRPAMSDRAKLPYTMAVLHEIQRFASVAPFGLPHSNPQPARLMGYDIPANSVVNAFFADVHRDPTVWRYPDDFNPGNFLDDDGHVINQDRTIPFSIGKRVCLGEGLAREELFIFFTVIMQNFECCVDESKPTPTLTIHRGVVDTPDNHFIVLKKRN